MFEPSARNVLPFQRPDPAQEARSRKVFDALSRALQQPVQELCTTVFQSGDDALFDRSERAENAQQQSTNFDTMRRLRLAHVDLAARAYEYVQRQLSEMLGTKDSRSGMSKVNTDSLSLVDPDTIEAEIAANAAANRVRQRYSADFQALNKRFSTVQVSGQHEGDNAQSIGPEILCLGFLDALTHFECTLETRIVLLKLFERELLKSCEMILMRAHAALNACQVATDVPYRTFQRPGAPPAAAPAAAAPGMAAPAAAGPAGGGAYSVDQAILGSLRELINMLGMRYAAHHRADISAQAPVASKQDLASALTELTRRLAERESDDMVPHALSATIADLLAKQRDGAHVQLRPLDAGVIDLIGLMFDYAVNDRNLPANMQALLGHLQIPYLKLALADPQFLARREHPARVLLNELAQASLGWTEANDRGLKATIERLVAELLANKEPNAETFERHRRELAQLLSREQQRVVLAERKASQAADGRSRMEQAKRDTEETLRARLAQTEVPLRLAKLIDQHWQQYLVLTHVRHGRDSREWLDALRLVELLSRFPKADARPENVAPWRKQFGEMEALLRTGLQQTGVSDGDCQQVIAGLRELVNVEHRTSPADRAVRFAEIKPLAPAPAAEEKAKFDLHELAEWMEKSRAFKSNTWFEMQRADGSFEQVKLLWISSDHQNFMFVNGNGVKAADRKLHELAADLKADRIRLLDSQPLVERALAAAMQRVRGKRAF